MNKAKRILFYSPYGQWYLHTLYEITLAHALELRGAEVKLIGCDRLFSDCDVHWENTSPRTADSCAVCQQTQETICKQLAMPVDWLGNHLPQGAEAKARSWVDGLNDSDLMTAIYGDIPLGEWVESSVHSHFRMRDLDMSDSKISAAYRSYLYSAALAYESLIRIFEEFKPDALFMLNGRFFSHRVAFEIARKRGIRVYNHERGRTDNSLRIFENETALTFDTLLKSWEQWKDQPLTKNELAETDQVFAERSRGVNTGWKSFVKAGAQDVTALVRQLGLSPEQKLVTLFTSSDDEAGVSKAWKPVIIDQFDWIQRSIAFFRDKPAYKLVIRVHPNIEGITGVNAQFLNRIQSLLPDLPENVHMVMPGDAVNSYQLIELSSAVLVYFSSLGLEAPFMGKPTLICSKGLFYDKGFALTLKSEQDYEAMLERLLNTSFTADFLRAAYRYGYHYFIRQNLPFPKVSVINVHNAKINYQSDEDLLPGKDRYLDRLCESVLKGRPVIPAPKGKRSPRAEKVTIEKRLTFFAEQQEKAAEEIRAIKTANKAAQHPLISVVIPCYNYAEYLPEAVESVVHQTFRDFEIIIVNDGSTDNSKEVAEALIKKYPAQSIRLLDQPNSGQPAITRNNGIQLAKGKYIVPLDADDKLDPKALELFYEALKPLDDIPAVAHGTLHYFGTETGVWSAQSFRPEKLLHRGYVPSCSMFTRSVWEKQGGYRLNVPGYEDWDFWIGALEHGAEFVAIPEVVIHYRKTEQTSLIDKAVSKHEWYMAKIIKNHSDIYEEIENAWADAYLQKHPQVPKQREEHGPGDSFPQVTSLLVSSYSEHYSEAEVRWAKTYSNAHPIPRKRLIDKLEHVVSESMPDALPETFFTKAIALFNKKAFNLAELMMHRYRTSVDYQSFPVTDNRGPEQPRLSVIIVAYATKELLIECLQSLQNQTNTQFEIIVVDNGGNESVEEKLSKFPILHIQCPANFILSEGRNIGVHFARGAYVAFLDDDATVPNNYTASIIEAFETYSVVGLRGKVLPKTNDARNVKAGHYDFGDTPFVHAVDAEGNSAFIREAYLKAGGMNPFLFGHEGSELSFRIFLAYRMYRTMYWPKTVIFHDYAFSDEKLEAKEQRHELMWDYLKRLHPDMREWLGIYNRFEQNEQLQKMGFDLLKDQNRSQSGSQPQSEPDPLISICIITYNRSPYILDAVNSALRQNGRSFEVLVVDDGSTDNTTELVQAIQNPRLRYVKKEHSGAPETRNFAIDQARGKYIVWLDSDDKLADDVLNLYDNYIDLYPEVHVFYGNLYVMDMNSEVFNEYIYPEFYLDNRLLLEKLAFLNQLPNPGKMVLKSAYEQVGRYNPEYRRAHDYEWYSRAAERLLLKLIPAHTCFYRVHEDSLSKTNQNHDTRYEAQITERLIKTHGLKKLFASYDWGSEPEAVTISKMYLLVAEHMLKLGQPKRADIFFKKAQKAHKDPALEQIYQEMKAEHLQKRSNKPDESPDQSADLPITAIISAYNEGDVIYHVIGDLVQQGIRVYLLDHHSTDDTVKQASRWLGKGLIKIETFPDESGYQIDDQTYSWRYILKRKEDISKQLGRGWYIHADADEFREAPWPELNLRQGIERVDREGYNAIHFLIYDFKPTDNSFIPGSDVRSFLKYYSSPKLAYDQVQLKCWKNEGQFINLWESGGHEVRFKNRNIYPIPFILRHYPIRSQEHGLKKIFAERKARWDEEERKAQWHAQYDHIKDEAHNFLHDPKTLNLYDREAVCAEIVSAFSPAELKETKPAEPDLVSIVFLTFNALKYTKLAVESILAHTHYPYELIIVDNHSTDGTPKYLRALAKKHRQVKVVFNKKNKGFAAGNNQGVQQASGKYVLILNNDILVADGWLNALVDALNLHERIGMVGPITNYISGLQQVTGVPYKDVSGFPEFAARVAKVNKNKITPRRRIAGFAMLMERDFYLELGGFDESFGTGNYEDDDLCLRVREAGKAIMVHEGVYIHHFGSQTFKANNMDYSASLEEKGKRFKEKWPQVNHRELLELENPLSGYINDLLSQTSDAMEQSDFATAKARCEAILNVHPIHTAALYLIAVCEQQLQQYESALNHLNTLIGLEPTHAEAVNLSGVILKQLGDADSAKQAFLKAIELEPALVDAQRNYGDLLIETGDYENGVQTFVTILNNHPHDIPALLYMSQLNLEAGNGAQAMEYARAVLRIEPENVLARQLMALIQQESGTRESDGMDLPTQYVCVAGMHRSGTSILTRLLHANGVSLGNEDRLLKANEDNPEGYWENEEIVKLNESILNTFGMGWDFVQNLPEGWENDPRLDSLKALARRLIESLGAPPLLAFKDPKNSLTFRFWQTLLPGLKAVIVFRNPLDVAYSLIRRNRFSTQRGLALWQQYNQTVLEQTERSERLFIRYENLLSDPEREIRRVLEWLQVPVDEQRIKQSAQLVKPELRHHHTSDLTALQNDPNFGHVWDLFQKMERLSEESGEWEQGENPFRKAIELLVVGAYAQAANAFEAALSADRENEEGLYGLALSRMGLKDYDGALDALNTLNRVHPDSAEVFNQIGLALTAKNEWEAAETAFKQAMKLNPAFIDAQRNYGDWLIRRERYEEGIVKFQEIILNHPDDVPSLLYLAQLNLEAGHLNDATVYVNKALSVQPENAIALQLKQLVEQESRAEEPVPSGVEEWIARANGLLEQGKTEEAQTLYQQALEQEPQNISARFGLGLTALTQSDLQTSAGHFKAIVEQDADFIPAYNQLGTIALIQQQYEQAVDYFSQSLERNNDQIHIRNLLAEALILNGDYQQGVQLLVNNADEYPENTEALFKLGEIYMEIDRQNEAQILFKRILQIEPQHQAAQNHLNEMNKKP